MKLEPCDDPTQRDYREPTEPGGPWFDDIEIAWSDLDAAGNAACDDIGEVAP